MTHWSASLVRIGLTACVASLVLVILWTATVLVPRSARSRGISPWAVIGKAVLWGPTLGAAFGGACAVLDQQAAGPLVGAAAIVGFVLGPWVAAISWAETLGVFQRGRKMKAAVSPTSNDAGVDAE